MLKHDEGPMGQTGLHGRQASQENEAACDVRRPRPLRLGPGSRPRRQAAQRAPFAHSLEAEGIVEFECQRLEVIGNAAALIEARVPAEKKGEGLARADRIIVFGLDQPQHVARSARRAGSVVMRRKGTRPVSGRADPATGIDGCSPGGPARSSPTPFFAADARCGWISPRSRRGGGIAPVLTPVPAPRRQALHLAPFSDCLQAEAALRLTCAGLKMVDDASPQSRRDVAVEEGLQAHARTIPNSGELVVIGGFRGGLSHALRSSSRALWPHLLHLGHHGITARDRGICEVVSPGRAHGHPIVSSTLRCIWQNEPMRLQHLAERTQGSLRERDVDFSPGAPGPRAANDRSTPRCFSAVYVAALPRQLLARPQRPATKSVADITPICC